MNQRHHWAIYLVAMTALLLWTGFVYQDTALSIVSTWERSATFAHGFLVLPIVLWLIWRKRRDLMSEAPVATPWMLAAIAGLGLLWLIGEVVGAKSVVQVAFVGILVTCVVSVLGYRSAKTIAFPLGFLFFGVPLGEFLLPILMERTADFTVFALQVSGVPVHREGLEFVIPSGAWSVVEACSGVRYLIASVTVGSLFAYLNYRSWVRRACFVAVSIVVPIIANWIRAYLIVMIGHWSNNRLAAGIDHIVYGWVFFGIVVALMLMIGARWSEPEMAIGEPAKHLSIGSKRGYSVSVLWVTVAASAALVALPHFAVRIVERSPAVEPGMPLSLPVQLNQHWRRGESMSSDWRPIFFEASSVFDATFSKDHKQVGLFIAYYRDQTLDRKLISSSNTLVRGNSSAWRIVAEGERQISCDGKRAVFRTATLRDERAAKGSFPSNLEVWKLYWIGGTLTSEDFTARWLSAKNRLTGRGDDSAAVIAYAAGSEAEQILYEFTQANCGLVGSALHEVQRRI